MISHHGGKTSGGLHEGIFSKRDHYITLQYKREAGSWKFIIGYKAWFCYDGTQKIERTLHTTIGLENKGSCMLTISKHDSVNSESPLGKGNP